MTEENQTAAAKKRDVILFVHDSKPAGINLEHVTHMAVEDNRINFNFYTNAIFIEFNDHEAAKLAFNNLMNIWSGDLVVANPPLSE